MLMIEMLARMPDLRRRIQAEHIADAGGRCRDCPGATWPCELYRMACEADRGHGPGRGAPGPFGRGTPGPFGPGQAGADARAAERDVWIAERGGQAPAGLGLPRQSPPDVVPVPAAPVWMSGPPARLAPVPPAPGSRWAGSAGPAGVGARLGGLPGASGGGAQPGGASGQPDGPAGYRSPDTDLPAPRTTIGAFPAVPLSGGAHPGSPAGTPPGAPGAPGSAWPTALSLRHDEVRARREQHLARRDQMRGRREDPDRRRDGGRHNLGWPSEDHPTSAPSGTPTRPHGGLIDVLAEVLRY
jgi:hypothetical protein